MTKIILVEDHRMLRGILHELLDLEPGLEVVGEAENGTQGLRLAEESKPDVVISDLRMEGMNGFEFTREIHVLLPATRVIILTMYGDPGCVAQAMEAGASGYVLKGADLNDLLQAIEKVASGQSYLSPALSAR
jgi:two-component system, NarL family, response regulator LiaR